MNGLSSVLANQTAISGIGATKFERVSSRSDLSLASEAVSKAIADAGLLRDEIDGFVTYTPPYEDTVETEVARNVGLGDLTFVARTEYGGGGAAATMLCAAMAVVTGVARNVVVYRCVNFKVGKAMFRAPAPTGLTGYDVINGWLYPYGFIPPVSHVAMFARRYMYESGATSEDFGRVAVADRKHAATNPDVYFYGRPITLEDHQRSRMIVEPLHLLDCCQRSVGAVAFVVSSADRARDLAQPAAIIRAAAWGSAPDQEPMTSFYRERLGLPEMGLVARQLWAMSGLGPRDMDVGILYDHFTPFVLMQLEELGFCDRGEARHFVADGNIELGGQFPINTNGGQLGEAYIHGLNGVLEAVRQIRGTSYNQVDDLEHVLVTGGTGVPTSAAVLGVDR